MTWHQGSYGNTGRKAAGLSERLSAHVVKQLPDGGIDPCNLCAWPTADTEPKAVLELDGDVLRQVPVQPTNGISRSYSAGTERNEWVSVLCTAKEQAQRDEAGGMRHRCAGAVHQHHSLDGKPGPQEPSRDRVAPIFSLPPPPSSLHRAAAQRHSLQELPCLSQPSRRPVHSGDPLPPAIDDTTRRPSHRGGEASAGQPAHLQQQDPWAPAGSQQQSPPQSEGESVFPSCHCSFSPNQPRTAEPLPPPPSAPFPPPIPPPPATFSHRSDRGDRLKRSVSNYQQASAVDRCRGGGGGGAGAHRDHRQLLQHCHRRDPSPETRGGNSQKGRSLNPSNSTEVLRPFRSQTRDPQQPQILQLRARQQLLVGSSLPVNHCASGSGEPCRTQRTPLLHHPQQHCEQNCNKISGAPGRVQPHGRVTPLATPHAHTGTWSTTGSGSSKGSPNYGSSYHLWPESPHKGEERIRIDLQKVADIFTSSR